MWASRKTLALLVSAVAFIGCARLGYYAHLGSGGLALVTRGDSVEKLLRDPETPEELDKRLRLAQALVEFARTELGLPVEKKYRKYLDLERPYVVWTVVATPEFGLEPKTWCFPIAGCVGYRGFFTREKADRFADRLGRQGLDVSVGGVRAFSSLGWFGDPLLNTFLFDEERGLAGLLFHELAHGRVYAKDDTAFNESFATAVEREAVRLWLEASASGNAVADVAAYRRSLDDLDDGYRRVERFRTRLEALYESSGPQAVAEPRTETAPGPMAEIDLLEMRRRKADLFAELQRDLASSDPARSSAFAGWIGRDLNNADLAALGFYRERLSSLEDLLQVVGGDLARFYASSQCLADLDFDERSRRLDARDWSKCILGGSVSTE